ncbi:hypothetical protein [Neisseria sp. Ec49-e6-T10]|uniref:HORMA-1 domain-containing protein n=1 Tax=Neisseria sp. Ec49-e6-T10 TaxID=3140744 RepID=UPI003EBB0BFD
MSSSYTTTDTVTITYAKHLASKVITDLKRIQRFYGKPSDNDILAYEEEIIQLIKYGYLNKVIYGFKKEGNWIEPTLIYNSSELQGINVDDDPGKIRPGKNVEDASFSSYLTYTSKWNQLSAQEKSDFKDKLPFKRTGAEEPKVNGYLESDKTYSSGGHSLSRSSVRSY